MVRMGTVWDRTVEVLNGRTGMIFSIALIGLVIPAFVRDVAILYSVIASPMFAFAIASPILSLVALPFMLWAQLAITAIATEPGVTRQDAARQGRARLLPALGLTLLLGLVAVIAMLPPIVALIWSGFDFASALSEGSASRVSPPSIATVVFIVLYVLLSAALAIWLFARLIVLYPVILNERLGLATISRAFTLTKGLTWRIIGVLLLFGIVVTIATGAAQSVTGLIFKLVLGDAGSLLTNGVVTLVSAAFTVVATVFTAQLYVAIREKHAVP
ncbi:MAG: hypothetical protein EOP66_07915 [Sphingomonas sp.]|nr:MAG: hypothetical protein EOP66_07915 [Sphingomonas sp.]